MTRRTHGAHDQARPPRRRAPLSRERVLRAAVALADAGRDRVAHHAQARRGARASRRCRCTTTSPTRTTSSTAWSTSCSARSTCRPDGGDWRAAMRRRAISAREVLARHPWAIGLMESRTHPGRRRCGTTTPCSGACARAGFSIELAAHAYSAARQLHLRLRAAGGEPAVRAPARRRRRSRRRSSAQFACRRVPAPHRADDRARPAARLRLRRRVRFGLDLILDGLAAAGRQGPGDADKF